MPADMTSVARRWPVRTFVAIFAVALFAFLFVDAASAQTVQPGGITDEAHDMHRLYLIVLSMGLAVFVVVEAALIYIIIRFRRKNDELPPQIHGNNALEVVWTGVPIIIVLTLFVLSFITLVNVEHEAKPGDLSIKVTGFQYQWQFTYDGNTLGRTSLKITEPIPPIIGTGALDPTVVIPVNEPVEFRLESNDVAHAFYVRDFLYKLDVIPGRDNRFVITARETGEFDGQCAELCGIGHARMRFRIRVVDRTEFDNWIKDQAGVKAARQP